MTKHKVICWTRKEAPRVKGTYQVSRCASRCDTRFYAQVDPRAITRPAPLARPAKKKQMNNSWTCNFKRVILVISATDFCKTTSKHFLFYFFYYYFSETQRRISLYILYGGDKLDGEPVNKMQTTFRGFGSNLKGAFVSSLSTNRASDSEAERISYRL